MKAALSVIAWCLAATLAPAQSRDVLELQIARAITDQTRPRVKQLSSGEWLRERLEVDVIAQGAEQPDDAGTPLGGGVSVVRARIVVHRSPTVPESMARLDSLPMKLTAKRYEVEMRFAPDAAYGLWVFVGGRYWIVDDEGQRQLELSMFPDLLRDAPLDAPHELAWAVMSP